MSESKDRVQPARVARTNGVRELSKTTRFYVPPVSELPRPRTMATSSDQDVTLSPKMYIPEVFAHR